MMHGVRKYNGTARSRMANFEELFATGFFGLRLPYYSTFGFISHMLYLHKVFIKIKNILYIIVAYVRVICMKNEQLIIIFLLANYYNAGCDKMQNHPIYISLITRSHIKLERSTENYFLRAQRERVHLHLRRAVIIRAGECFAHYLG